VRGAGYDIDVVEDALGGDDEEDLLGEHNSEDLSE
jgi:hypothetical protein